MARLLGIDAKNHRFAALGKKSVLTIYCKSHGFCKFFCESVCQRRNHSNADANFTIAK